MMGGKAEKAKGAAAKASCAGKPDGMMARGPKKPKTGMARLMELGARKKGLIACSCALAVVSVAASFAPFVAIYGIIGELVAHYADLPSADAAYMARCGWLAAGSAVLAIALNFLALMCSHIAAFTTQYELKLEFAEHIASLPLGFHSANATGRLRKVADDNIEKLEGFVAHQLPDLAGSFAMPAIAIALLLAFDWRLGLASLVPIAAAYLIQMSALGGGKSKEFMKRYQDSLDEMNSAAVEYVRGISVVKAFNQTVYSFRKFHEAITDYGRYVKNYSISFEKHMAAFMTITNFVYIFLMPAIIAIAGGTDDYPRFALAALFYIVFSFSLATPFTKLIYVSSLGTQVADGIERMDKVLAARLLPETKAPKQPASHDIVFEDVSFAYANDNVQYGSGGACDGRGVGKSGPHSPDNDSAPAPGGIGECGGLGKAGPHSPDNDAAPALSGVTFTAAQGQTTALVGPSGSGKSTIAHLIPRFYDVGAGSVSIGGTDIRDMSGECLMGLVAFVFQDVFLFRQSIVDNILIGRKDATREEALAAAKAAQCDGFAERLPRGYDTVVGSSGVHLSGGERQRVVIARAILKGAPILVLDEATAFADPENERNIQLALSELIRGKTVIIIAHRLSTVRGADKILVVDQGRIVEQGTHDSLVCADGRYSRMWGEYVRAMDWTLGNGGIEAGGESHVDIGTAGAAGI